MADRTAWRLCSANGWWSVFGKPKAYAKAQKAGAPAHKDLVARDFTADGPNRLWLTDITEHRTGEGRMKSRLAVGALDTAVARRAVPGADTAGCIVHSDRGSQFRSRSMQRALARHAMAGSIRQVASAADNAAMESFFALLQRNVLDRRAWRTRDELRIAIVAWIERTLPPSPPTSSPQPIDAHRIRDDHDPDRRPSGLTHLVTESRSSPVRAQAAHAVPQLDMGVGGVGPHVVLERHPTVDGHAVVPPPGHAYPLQETGCAHPTLQRSESLHGRQPAPTDRPLPREPKGVDGRGTRAGSGPSSWVTPTNTTTTCFPTTSPDSGEQSR